MIEFFHKITDLLNRYNIPYMLSGSVAMSLYIVPRATRDFDFVIHLLPEHIAILSEHFKDHYYYNEAAVQEAVNNRGMFNIIDHASGYKADFIILKKDSFHEKEFSRKIEMDYYGKTIYVVSAEDLLLSKLIWIQQLQSGVQMEDIRNLSILDLDWNYIKHWILRLNLNTFGLLKNE